MSWRLHPQLGQFRAIPQALIRQAGPVLAPGQFRIDRRHGLVHAGGNFFRWLLTACHLELDVPGFGIIRRLGQVESEDEPDQ